MSNDVFDGQLLAQKLSKLNNSQQSIESLSHWCISHRKKAKQIVETWDKLFNCSQKEQCVSFLYLANDILQNSRRKGSEFVNEFWKVLPAPLKHVYDNGDEYGKKAVSRLITYPSELMRVMAAKKVQESGNFTQNYQLRKRKKGGFTMANMDDIGCVAVRVVPNKDKSAIDSYDKTSTLTSPYILRTIMKPKIEDKVMLVYESFDTTLEKWVGNNDLMTEDNLKFEFLQIIRDVLRGLEYLHHEGIFHGGLDINDVVIKQNRGKLVNIRTKSEFHDCQAFASMVYGIFRRKMMIMPIDLKRLLQFMENKTISKSRRLTNIGSHPIFLEPEGKLSYRMMAFNILDYHLDLQSDTLFETLSYSLGAQNWKEKIPKSSHFDVVREKAKTLKSNCWTFLCFGRNVVAHINEGARKWMDEGESKCWIEAKEVAHVLDQMWPGFLSVIHEVYQRFGINMFVYDTLLK